MKKVIKVIKQLFIAALFALFFSGCFAIDQWQRQYLGDSIMNFDYDAEESILNEHIYPRREGSSGGYSGAGGGCGC
ncbi:DUF4266 domain-containing protein [Fibrobacterota bacterium]